jgi:hypothetical protein
MSEALGVSVDARTFALTYRAVSIAWSDDKERPALYRTLAMERFPEGVRLVATDGYVLLKGWVPNLDWQYPTEPDVGELPQSTAIISDRRQRGLALAKYVLDLTRDDESDEADVSLSIATVLSGGGSLDGMAPTRVLLTLNGVVTSERLYLPTYEGVFPDWRTLDATHTAVPADEVRFGAMGVLRLGKLADFLGGASIAFRFAGETGAVAIEVEHGSGVDITGLAMPVRAETQHRAEAA